MSGVLALLPLALALAGAQRVVIVALVAGGGGDTLTPSRVHDDVAAAVSESAGLSTISGEELFVTDDSLQARVQDCASEAACIAAELRPLAVRLGIVALVSRDVDPPLVALRLVDVEHAREAGTSVGPLEPGEGGLSAALRRRARRLLDQAGFPAAVRLFVVARPAGATLSVDPIAGGGEGPVEREVPAGHLFLVPPGRHVLRGVAEGYLPGSREVTVEPGQEVRVELELEAEPSPLTSSPWFWIGAGAAVILGAAAVVAATQGSECVCVAAPGVECPPC